MWFAHHVCSRSATIISVRSVLGGFFSLIFALGVSAQTITGVVVDSTSAPIPNADVSLVNSSTVQTTTDNDGRFSLTGTVTNHTRLLVRATGFTPFERTLAPDGVFDFTIVLQPAALSESVNVTITRDQTNLDETPASVVVMTRDDLDATAAQTVDDTLRQVAGFTLFRAGSSKTTNPTTQGANLRGVSGSGAARTSVLFDGLSLNDAFGGWTYWSRVPHVAVERIEILRGGASSIYGSGGLSGAINILPVRPEDGETIVRAESSAGNQKTFDGGIFFAHSRRGWAFDFTADAFTTGGYIPIAEDERGLVDTPATSTHSNVIVALERGFTGGRVFARGSIFSEDRDNGTLLTINTTHFRQLAVGGDVTRQRLGRIEARAFVQTQVYDQTFSAVSIDRNTETLTRLQRVPSQAVGGQLFWTRPFDAHAIASSAEYRDVRGFSDELGFSSSIATSASGAGGHERTVSFFAQDFWRVNKRLNVSFGGRYDRWENVDAHSATRIFATNALTSVIFSDRNDSAFSPRLGAIYDASENVSIYASYSRSFRAPTLNELYRGFRVGNVVTQANEKLRAERANTFEGGVLLSQRRLTIRTSAFVTTVSDPVVSITLSSSPVLTIRRRQNVGETRSRGVEVDAELSARRDLLISASYLLVDARVTSFPDSESLVGNHLPQVPAHQLSLQLRYRPTSRWTLGMQTRFSSSRFEDDVNTFRLGAYTTTDSLVSFRPSERMEIFAAAENVFNNRYDIGLTPNRTVAGTTFVRIGLRIDFRRR